MLSCVDRHFLLYILSKRVKIKKEEPVTSDDEDLILIDEDIKREQNNDNSFITGYMDNSHLSSITAAPQSQVLQTQQQQDDDSDSEGAGGDVGGEDGLDKSNLRWIKFIM